MKHLRNKVFENFDGASAQHPDPNMNDAYWMNMDKAQTHYLVSVLKDHYPRIKEAYKTPIEVPPGRVVWLLHKYYTIHTRDKTPAKGGWVKDEAINAIPPSLLMKPEPLY